MTEQDSGYPDLSNTASTLPVGDALIDSATTNGSSPFLFNDVENGSRYFQGPREEARRIREEADSAKNGPTRQATAGVYDKFADFLNKIPGLTANRYTYFNEALVGGACLASVIWPEYGFLLAAIPYTIGGVGDGADGKLSKLKGTDNIKGMLTDDGSDRRQEMYAAIANFINASRRGFDVAAVLYIGAEVTASWPAYFRSSSESQGRLVSEDAFGSRVSRAIMGGIGIGFNQSRLISTVNSAAMVIGNTRTAVQRADVAIFRDTESPYSRGPVKNPEDIPRAQIRNKAQLPYMIASLAVGAGLAVGQLRKK